MVKNRDPWSFSHFEQDPPTTREIYEKKLKDKQMTWEETFGTKNIFRLYKTDKVEWEKIVRLLWKSYESKIPSNEEFKKFNETDFLCYWLGVCQRKERS